MRNLAFAGSLALLAACSAPRFDATARFGTFDIEGKAGISNGGSVAKADLETAGLEKDDSVFGLRGDFDWGPSHVMVSGQQTTHDGNGTLETTFTSGGTTIPAGADVESDLDLGLYSAAYTFDFIPTDLVEVGLGLGVTYLDVNSSFQDLGTGERIDTDEQIPVPVLAARLGTRIWRLDASLQASGMDVSYSGDDVYLVDLDLMAKLRLFGGDERLAGHVTAGYRWLDLELDYDDGDDSVKSEATFQGPYLGLTVSI